MLFDWRYNGAPDGSYPSNVWARDSVCRAVRNISTLMKQYLPAGHPKQTEIVSTPVDFPVIQLLSSIGIVVCIGLITAVQMKRDQPKMKQSQPIFLQLILFGGLLLYISCILQLQRASSSIFCNTIHWTLNFGWGVFFVPLLLKTYRLYAVFDAAKRMKRVTVRTEDLMIILMAWLLIIEGTLSLVITFVIKLVPKPKFLNDLRNPNTLLSYQVCEPASTNVNDLSGYTAIYIIAICLNLILVLVGVVLAIRTRNISSKFSESSQLAGIMYNSLLFATLYVVFSVLPSTNPDFLSRAYALLLFIGVTINLTM